MRNRFLASLIADYKIRVISVIREKFSRITLISLIKRNTKVSLEPLAEYTDTLIIKHKICFFCVFCENPRQY